MSTAQQFAGFPAAGLQFLADLAANNNAEWFNAQRAIYEATLLEPAKAFVLALGSRLQTISPDIRFDTTTNGSGTLMRIHRDVRFSPDKSPYKTNISGLFWQGVGKKLERPAFGFQLGAEGMLIMAGIFAFPKPMLQAYRDAVADAECGADLVRRIQAVRNAGPYALQGEQYKRVPAGYAGDHPRADLLRYSGLYVSAPPISVAAVQSAALVDLLFDHFQKMAPVQQWLVQLA